MKFGEHRGGMFIEARGIQDDKDVAQSWHFLAEADDDPYIPSMDIMVLFIGRLVLYRGQLKPDS